MFDFYNGLSWYWYVYSKKERKGPASMRTMKKGNATLIGGGGEDQVKMLDCQGIVKAI